MRNEDNAGAVSANNIYLIGFMGAGKSAVGKRLAVRLGVDFVDLDQVVEAAAEMSIPELFSALGEEHFRRLESRALEEQAGSRRRLVIATGGGTPASEVNLTKMLATGTTVWLDVSFDLISTRVEAEGREKRPMFASPAEARALYDERRRWYSRAALRIEVSPEESADRVAERLARVISPAGRGPIVETDSR